MRYEEFLQPVVTGIGGDTPAAERAVRATLLTLAERIGKDEALHLVPALPEQVAPWLYTTGPAQRFDPADFVSRVARREETPVDVAEHHTAVVFAALGQALDDEAYRHVTARLPKTFAPLLPKGTFAGDMAVNRFEQTVAERAGLAEAEASRVCEVVLETLAKRIGGDADDLMVFLPVRLHPALSRGKAQPATMTAEEFVTEIGRRTGATPDRAIRLVRAVLTTLRDVVDNDEFFDIQAQMTGPFRELLRER